MSLMRTKINSISTNKQATIMLRDLTGQTFGKMTVIERTKDHVTKSGKRMVQWLCRCECGNLHVVLSTNLKNGITTSCGCVAREMSREAMKSVRAMQVSEDLTGMRFNTFTVIGKTQPYKDPKYGYKHYQYICKCDCGELKTIRADMLKQGKAVCKVCKPKKPRKKYYIPKRERETTI